MDMQNYKYFRKRHNICKKKNSDIVRLFLTFY